MDAIEARLPQPRRQRETATGHQIAHPDDQRHRQRGQEDRSDHGGAIAMNEGQRKRRGWEGL